MADAIGPFRSKATFSEAFSERIENAGARLPSIALSDDSLKSTEKMMIDGIVKYRGAVDVRLSHA